MSCARYFNPKLRKKLVDGQEPEWLKIHPRRSYIVRALLATPAWSDRKKINALRDEARRLTKVTGVEHVLDHKIPLNHPYVCGLQVPENMQILTRQQNGFKGNKWNPDQLIFEEF